MVIDLVQSNTGLFLFRVFFYVHGFALAIPLVEAMELARHGFVRARGFTLIDWYGTQFVYV